MNYLLDVNVLLAAIWMDHPHHAKVFAWLDGKPTVVCPVSELGFVRISVNKKAFNFSMERARQGLESFFEDRKPGRIPDDLPALESHPLTSDQVTDHYLADLAVKHGLKLAALDGQLKHPAAELVL
jgi:predicted nucleic acid-binding protein